MNFLGHIYLSGSNEEVLLGNFSGDFLKGRTHQKYPPDFQKGVKIHRAIDTYTDHHSSVLKLNRLFYEKYHKYSGVIVDVAFDHMLGKTWALFSKRDLYEFIGEKHEILNRRIEETPLKVQKMIPSFIHKKWLETYQTVDGLELVYSRMALRTSLPAFSGFAVKTIRDNYNLFLDEFVLFFEDIIKHISTKFEIEFDVPGDCNEQSESAK